MSHNEHKPVQVVSPGVVRCLLKQTFYLRIPKDDDLESKTLRLPPDEDVFLEYRDFDLVRDDLIQLDHKNIVRIIKYPEFLPDDTDLHIDVYEQGVLISANISGLNFVGAGASVTDAGNGRADILTGVPPLGGSPPESVGIANFEGVSGNIARADHIHQGVHSIAVPSGSPQYADILFQSGANITISNSGNTFIFDVIVGATDELQVVQQIPSALAVDYQGGKILVNGTLYNIAPGTLPGLPPSSSLDIYADIDGIVKFTAGDVPSNAVWMASVITNGGEVTSVSDKRVFLNQNITSGSSASISIITPNAAANSGTSESFARADHVHAIAVAPAVQLLPNMVNGEGTSSAFARADHIHNIPTAAAISINAGSLNTDGTANTFSRSDHTHAIPTAAPVTLNPDALNAIGASLSFARADHVHNIPTDVAIDQVPDAGNNEGVSISFARADHRHNIPTGAPVSISSASNIVGVASSFSRADHVHAHGNLIGGTLHANATTVVAGFMSSSDKLRLDNLNEPDIQKDNVTISSDVEIINFSGPNVTVTDNGGFKTTIFIGNTPATHASTHLPAGTDPLATAGPTTTLSAVTVNTEGNAQSFARSDHIHAILTGTATSQTPDQTNSTGTSFALARADHIHNIPTAVPVSVASANAQGVALSFARSDHVHSHGALGGGSQHAVVTTSVAGFMSAPDKIKLDFLDQPDVQKDDLLVTADVKIFNFEGPNVQVTDDGSNKVTVFINNVPGLHAATHLPNGSDPISTGSAITLSATTANGTGTSNLLARSDHTHQITTGNVNFLGSGVGANQPGTGAALARADHVHAWQQVTSFATLPASPVSGQVVYANYGSYKGFFAYDAVRAKWLSTEVYQISWNTNVSTNSINVNLVAHDDNTQQDNDYPIFTPITLTGILGAQVNAITASNETRFEISSYNLGTATLTQNVTSITLSTLGAYSVTNFNLNVDIPALQVLSARRVNAVGTDPIIRPMIAVQYRARLA